ncbi:MAG TPA: hypothetical protein VIH58_02890, partial [Chthoniobacterales bacterium]
LNRFVFGRSSGGSPDLIRSCAPCFNEVSLVPPVHHITIVAATKSTRISPPPTFSHSLVLAPFG